MYDIISINIGYTSLELLITNCRFAIAGVGGSKTLKEGMGKKIYI